MSHTARAGKSRRQTNTTTRRRRTSTQNDEHPLGYEPLSLSQRRRQWGLVAVCMVGSLLLAMTVVLFTAMLLNPQAGGNPTGMLIFVLVPGVFLVLLMYFGAQYLMDAWTGVASIQVLKLRERQASRKGITHLVFEQVGTLSFHHDIREASLPEMTNGRWYRVTYSAYSRTIWSINQVSSPGPKVDYRSA